MELSVSDKLESENFKDLTTFALSTKAKVNNQQETKDYI